MIKEFLVKHKVLLNPGLLKQEFVHVALGRKYWIKYITNKKFRLSEQKKRKALDDWNDECNQEIFKDLFNERSLSTYHRRTPQV